MLPLPPLSASAAGLLNTLDASQLPQTADRASYSGPCGAPDKEYTHFFEAELEGLQHGETASATAQNVPLPEAAQLPSAEELFRAQYAVTMLNTQGHSGHNVSQQAEQGLESLLKQKG